MGRKILYVVICVGTYFSILACVNFYKHLYLYIVHISLYLYFLISVGQYEIHLLLTEPLDSYVFAQLKNYNINNNILMNNKG